MHFHVQMDSIACMYYTTADTSLPWWWWWTEPDSWAPTLSYSQVRFVRRHPSMATASMESLDWPDMCQERNFCTWIFSHSGSFVNRGPNVATSIGADANPFHPASNRGCSSRRIGNSYRNNAPTLIRAFRILHSLATNRSSKGSPRFIQPEQGLKQHALHDVFFESQSKTRPW